MKLAPTERFPLDEEKIKSDNVEERYAYFKSLVKKLNDVYGRIADVVNQNANAPSGSGKVVQVVRYQTGAVATGSTIIPQDDTIPQNTEGDQYMTCTITPTSASNTLRIDVVAYLVHSVSGFETAALFQDNIVSALAVGTVANYYTAIPTPIKFTHFMTAGGTSATTFKVRGGAPVAGTTTFNGASGARLFGGVMASSIAITEIAG